MCDKEQLVAYLYDDIDAADRVRIDAHLQACAACREELRGLHALRRGLAQWAPPEPDLGFRVVQDRPPSWRAWWTPAFGLAAAAVLLLAVASALAHVEVRYGQDGVSVRTGWGAAPSASPAVTPAALSPAAVSQLDARYAALDRRLRQIETSAPAAPASPVRQVSAASARMSDVEVLRRVKDLLAQSESRQQQALAFRVAQVLHDVDAQRVADLARIQQGLGRIDAMTTQEAAAHRDLANYIITSARQK